MAHCAGCDVGPWHGHGAGTSWLGENLSVTDVMDWRRSPHQQFPFIKKPLEQLF